MANDSGQFDRDALLMMYAADEMSAAQRAEFERRLAGDAQLAADLGNLRAAQQSLNARLTDLDHHERPPVSDAVATRRAVRAMNQWHLNRAAVARPSGPARNLPLPWWMYGSSVAAAILIGFLVWSSRQEVPPLSAPEETTRNMHMMEADEDALADSLDASFQPADNVLLAETFTAPADDVGPFFMTPVEEKSQ